VLHEDNLHVWNAVLKPFIRVCAYRSICICTYIYMGSNLYIRLCICVSTNIKFCFKQVVGYTGAIQILGILFWSLLHIYVHTDLYIYILYVCLNTYILVCIYICTHIQFCFKQVVGNTGAIHTVERCLGAFYVYVYTQIYISIFIYIYRFRCIYA